MKSARITVYGFFFVGMICFSVGYFLGVNQESPAVSEHMKQIKLSPERAKQVCADGFYGKYHQEHTQYTITNVSTAGTSETDLTCAVFYQSVQYVDRKTTKHKVSTAYFQLSKNFQPDFVELTKAEYAEAFASVKKDLRTPNE